MSYRLACYNQFDEISIEGRQLQTAIRQDLRKGTPGLS
jgi:hypothetical protein